MTLCTASPLQAINIWRNPDVMATKASLPACLSLLGCIPDWDTNQMKFVQELSFAQHHPLFSHQGLKPVPILNFFALSPQDQPPRKPLQTLKVHRLSGTNFSRERSS